MGMKLTVHLRHVKNSVIDDGWYNSIMCVSWIDHHAHTLFS